MEAYNAFREVVVAEEILQVRQVRLDLERRLATDTSPNMEDIEEEQEAVAAARDIADLGRTGRASRAEVPPVGP